MHVSLGATPYLHKVFSFVPLARAGKLYHVVLIHPLDVSQNPSWIDPDLEGSLIFVEGTIDAARFLEAFCDNDNVTVGFTHRDIYQAVKTAVLSGDRSVEANRYLSERIDFDERAHS